MTRVIHAFASRSVLLALVLGAATPAAALDGMVAINTGASLFVPTLAIGIEGGIRWERWGLLARADWNPWFSTSNEKRSLEKGSLNLGVGGELRYFGGAARSAVFVGTSTLLFDTGLDRKGKTGVSLDFVTVTLRWPLGDWFVLRYDPCTVHVVMPVLDRIPLILFEYRHSVSGEVTF